MYNDKLYICIFVFMEWWLYNWDLVNIKYYCYENVSMFLFDDCLMVD